MVRNLQKETEPSGSVATSYESNIAQFFRDRTIFITGATGFLGKVLLEKLLRSCSGIRNIYVLLRPKDGQDIRQRLDELFSTTLYEKLRWDFPKATTKVIPINGDVTLTNLGVTESDLKLLTDTVSVVFHCAATVRFDEPFKKAVRINLIGTKNVVDVCKSIHNLACMVHVSTAYSFCNKKEISEVIYPEPVSPEKIIEATEWMNEGLLNCIMDPLLDGRPSNYHYTKALAEILVDSSAGTIPTAIVRPSIVTAAAYEPIPGWVDNLYGPSGFIVAAGKGALRTMHVYPDITVDCIPVDMVSNMIITAAWHVAIKRPEKVQVYNCTSGSLNRMTWKHIEKTTYPLTIRHPSMEVIRYPGGSFKKSRIMNELSLKIEHHFPAHVLDLLAWITGHKGTYVQQYKKMERALHILEYFTIHEWTFSNDNTLALMNEMKGRDREIFSFDVRNVDWNTYMENYVLGVRRFVLKEDEATLPAARIKLNRIYYLTKLAHLFALFGLIRVLIGRSKAARRIWKTGVFLALQIPQMLSLT